MPPNPDDSRLGKRRAPTQSRSRNTVECIKQAAQKVIAEAGFAAATTGRIAERAGVSIGSLYQYFATREAIFLALYEDVSVDLAAQMKRQALRILDQPLERGVRSTTTQMFNLNVKHKLILIDLVREMPEMNLAAHPLAYDNLIRGSIKAFVVSRTPSSRPADIDRTIFFLERIVIDSIRAYLRAPPARLTKNALIDEITAIATSYLTRRQTDASV
ncbi:TetR/AcrR family transcriptional regulator [soil metagenome]